MSFLFKEINEKILKFNKNEQITLVKHYIKSAIAKITDGGQFDHKKLLVLLNVLQYAQDEESKIKLIHSGLNHKILSIRALILDLIDIDFSREQNVFYKPDKWTNIILRDIKETFQYDDLLVNIKYKERRGIDKINFNENINTPLSEEEMDGDSSNHDDLLFNNYNNLNVDVTQFNDIYAESDVMLCLNLYNRRLCKEFIDIFCSCDKFNSSGNQLVLNMLHYIDKMSFIDYDWCKFIKKIRSNFNKDKSVKLDKLVECYLKYKDDKKKEPVDKANVNQ